MRKELDELERVKDYKRGSLLKLWLEDLCLVARTDKGDEFVSFVVEDLFNDAAGKITLKHEEGEILIVNFWSVKCESERDVMAYIQGMLDKNAQNWGKNVRIVGVNVDYQKEEARPIVQEKNWNKVVHYYLPPDLAGVKIYYGVSYRFPEVFLVDQKGIIVQTCLSNLQENINNLLQGKPVQVLKEETKEVLEPFTLDDHKKLTSFLNNPKFHEEVRSYFKYGLKYNPKFNIEITKITTFDGDLHIQQVKSNNPEISLSLRKSDFNKANPVLSRIYELVSCNKIKENLEFSETFDVVWGTECHSCKKELKAFDQQYFCFWCKIYFCPECGDTVDTTKKGNDRLLHPHNMIWINISNEDGLKEIDLYKLGRNIMYTENHNLFEGRCKGCKGIVGGKVVGLKGGYRYICISCRPGPKIPALLVDLCELCMTTLRLKEVNEQNMVRKEKVLAELSSHQHDVHSHLWLRICFGHYFAHNYFEY